MSDGYDARSFWTDRLGKHFSLKGVGQWEYNDAYNDWLYRAKGDALEEALGGLGGRALDVGSGVGWVVRQLVERDFAVDGCDITQQAVDHLASEYPGATFTRLAIGSEPLPAGDSTYDVVTMMDVAYHITDDELWESALAEIARVLVPGGRLVFTDQLGRAPEVAGEHVRFRPESQWRAAADRCGMDLTSTGVLYRRLSRRRDLRGWRRLPDGLRGRVEYHLDRRGRGEPTLRWGVLTRSDA